MDQPYSPDWLIVVGSSAGGIESLTRLVASLPEDFPVPLIIAQHLHPGHASRLQEILQSRTTLPVKAIEGRLDLEPGVIFIASPNSHIEISDHDVQKIEDGHDRPMPSVNLLFESAVETFRERLVAVILSGTGSDGATGAKAVKDAGGIVLIENPQTSAFPQMALAIPPSIVDLSVDLEAVGPLLRDLVSGAYVINPQDEQSNIDWLLAEVNDRSGIDFSNYKEPTIMRRIHRRLVATNSHNLDEYLYYTRENPEEYEMLANSFLIKVTEFFRDPELFNHFLLNRALDPLIERALETGELRIWSAGCATGEEAYSLAIVVQELLGEAAGRVNVRIFGTDIDPESIAYARRGIYPASALDNLSQELIDRYFIPQDGLFEVRNSIRLMVVFGEHDLAQRSPFPRIDLAFCRNVLIYFTTELQRRALQLFAFALRDDGLLILGKAETVSPLAEYFSLMDSQLKIYQRTGNNVMIPAVHFTDLRDRTMRVQESRETSRPSTLTTSQQRSVQQPRETRAENILQTLPIGIVLVDREYRVLFANLMAREHLGIQGVAINDDLIHVARSPSLAELRDAIDSAFTGEEMNITYEITVQLEDTDEDQHYVELTCMPYGDGSDPGSIEVVMVQTRNVTILESVRADLREINERFQQLTNTHRSLRLANDRLVEANRQLHADNENLLISNEEFQAAAEEVETLNEELQATNEELETLNEELQATIEELRTTNEELQARTEELERLAAERKGQGE